MENREVVAVQSQDPVRSLWWLAAWALLATALSVAAPRQAAAGTFEVSLGISFNQSNYGGGNFEWTRKWGASVGYYFFSVSEI
ncbi:MAG: hypothetical protein ACXWP5_12550, partial [Bdellovibrionota bacterium]